MKKTAIILSAIITGTIAMPAIANAVNEYPEFPDNIPYSQLEDMTEDELNANSEAHLSALKQLCEDFRNGKYDWDFNLDGKTDTTDAHCIGWYYIEKATSRNDLWYDEYTVNGAEFYAEYYPTDEWREKIEELGDIDGDGRINTSDESLMLYAMLKSHKTGDVNTDGAVDARDSSDILSYYSAKATNEKLNYDLRHKASSLGDITGDQKIDARDASEALAIYTENATK